MYRDFVFDDVGVSLSVIPNRRTHSGIYDTLNQNASMVICRFLTTRTGREQTAMERPTQAHHDGTQSLRSFQSVPT